MDSPWSADAFCPPAGAAGTRRHCRQSGIPRGTAFPFGFDLARTVADEAEILTIQRIAVIAPACVGRALLGA